MALVVVLLGTGVGSSAREVTLQRSARFADPIGALRREPALHAALVAREVGTARAVPLSVDLTPADRAALRAPRSRAGRVRVGVVRPLGATVDFSDLAPGPVPAVERRRAFGALRGTQDGGYVWTAVLESAEARALRLRLASFALPEGAALWIYNDAGQVRGPYGGAGPQDEGDFWTHTLPGSVLVAQLHVPGHARGGGPPTFDIADVGHLGAGFGPAGVPAPEAGGNLCDFNEACVENASCATIPAAIQDARDAVALIEFVSGPFLYTCSGGLVADTDTATDLPYLLTANHCLSKKAEADSLEAFFQVSTACGGICAAPVGPSTLGSDVVATDRDTDFTLLLLDESAPAGTAFLGWTSTPVAFSDGLSLFRVSHPSGAPQAYAEHVVDTSRITCQGWPRGDRIYSADTFGGTEGGSSGSPVLNAAGQIVGQLAGACGLNVDDPCDAVNNATVDGAFAAYFAMVQPLLDPGGGTTTTSSSSSTSSTSTSTSSSSTTSTTTSSSSSTSSTAPSTTSTSSTVSSITTASSSSSTSSSTSTSTSSTSSTSTSSSTTSSSTSSTTTSSTTSSTTSTMTSSSTSIPTTVTTTSTTTSTLPGACGAAPRNGCDAPRAAVLAITGRRAGRARLAFAARRFDTGLSVGDLGDPVGGTTAYRLCIYDGTDRLVGRLAVDRAGGTCGSKDRACWKALGTKGYLYRDEASAADGVKRLLAKGGRPGKGTVRLQARNEPRQGFDALPTGLAAALEGSDRATAQIVTSDAGCVSAVLERVRKADAATFKAKARRVSVRRAAR